MFSDSRRAGRRCLAAAEVWQTSWHHVRRSNAGLRHLDGQAMLAFVPKTIPSPLVGLAMGLSKLPERPCFALNAQG